MTRIGWIRAAQLARGGPVSLTTIKRMSSFLARHEPNLRKAMTRIKAGDSKPWRERALIAWLGWGGDAAKLWTAEILADLKTSR